MAAKKTKIGRPTDYTPELAEEICNVIASSSKGITRLCSARDHWPCPDTIFTWLRQHKEFSEQYAQAKRHQVDVLVEDILDIADDASLDNVVNDNGDIGCNTEWINRARLKIDTRKWLASKLVPRVYGNSIKYTAEVGISVEERLKELE